MCATGETFVSTNLQGQPLLIQTAPSFRARALTRLGCSYTENVYPGSMQSPQNSTSADPEANTPVFEYPVN